MTPDWLRAVLAAVRPLLPRDFIGCIEVNVFKGGVANVTLRQSFKDDEAGPPVLHSHP